MAVSSCPDKEAWAVLTPTDNSVGLDDSHKGLCGLAMAALPIPLAPFANFYLCPLPGDAGPVECFSLCTLASLGGGHGTGNRKSPGPASGWENQLVINAHCSRLYLLPCWMASFQSQKTLVPESVIKLHLFAVTCRNSQ